MPQKKCSKDCLKCKLPKCIHDIDDERKLINEKFRKAQNKRCRDYSNTHKAEEKARHAKYYQECKAEIDAKQKEYDKLHHAENWQRYYASHIQEVKEKNKKYYKEHKAEICDRAKKHYQEHRAEISARRKELYRARKAEAAKK